MKIIKTVIFISFAFLASCLKPMKAPVLKTSRIKIGTIKIAQIQIKNDQLILNGEFLNQIKSIKIQDNAVLSESFVIESQSGSKVIANGLQNLSLGVNALFDLVISSAAGAATYSIDFSLANGSVTGSKLSQMGAATGQVLTWDGSVWTPSTATASNIYLGAWDAAGDSPDLSSLAGNCGTSGEYYIASTANANVGFDSLVNISIGDWVICNNSGNWESISISSGVTTIDGMTDSDLTAPALDDVLVYDGVKWVNSKTKLSKLSDIDVGFAPNNLEVLTYDGTDWNAVSILSTIIAEGRLNDFHISALAASKLTGALPAIDGSNLTGITATDVSKLPLTGGALSGDLTVNANIITTGTVNGVNVTTLGASITANTTNIAANATAIIGKEATLAAGTVAQYYKGDKTWASFETSVLGSLLAGYTKAGAATAIVVGDTISQALGKLEYKVDNAGSGSGDFMKDGSVVMTGNLDLGNRKLVGNGGTVGVEINAVGKVGIGTSAPTEKLTVDGNINVTAGKDICIDGSGCLSAAVAEGGETNTASSAGGTSLFKVKSTTDLVFKGLTATSSNITLTSNTNDVGIEVNTGTGNNQIVKLDGTAKLPAIDGSQLTNLPNTNAGAICAAGQYLDGDATCKAIPTGTITGSGTDNFVPLFNTGTGIDASAVSETELNILDSATVTTAELNYVDGVTSSIQNQLDALVAEDAKFLEHDGSIDMTADLNTKEFGFIFTETQAPKTATVKLIAPLAISASYILRLPPNTGNMGQVLSTDGSGVTTWANAATDTNTQLSEANVETFIANDITTGFVPYDNGTKIIDSNIYYDGSGEVGIGTNTPAEKLHIKNTASVKLKIETSSASDDVGLLLKNNTNEYGFFIDKSDANKLKIYDNTASAPRLTISTTGKVGIGNTNPSGDLTIGSEGNGSSVLSVKGSDVGSGEGAELQLFIDENFDTTHEFWRIDAFEDDLRFGPTGSTRLIMKASGNIGIGVTDPDPDAKLEINGQIKITGGTPGASKVLTSDANGLATWEAAGAADNLGNHEATQNIDLNAFKLVGNNGTAGIKIGSTGNVGIGVAGNPVYKLQVNGDAQISSDIEITGEASIQGMHFGKGHGGAGHSVGIGESVLGNTSDYNTAIGYRSMQTAGTGVKNTAIGASSFQSNGAGSENTAIGYKSLNLATSSSSSSALGAYSLSNLTTGINNTAIGSFSLKSETSGKENTGVGYKAAEKNNGDYNTAIGTLALFNSASGDLNTTIGYKSGHRLKTGSHSNVVIGSEAEGALVQSSGNVVIGHRAGEQITGADSADGVNRQKGRLIIANGNTASDTWIYGDSDHNIGIGINDPEKRLHLHKSSNAGPYLRITNDATTTGGTRGLIFGYNSENNLIFRNQENSKIIFNVNNNADDSLILASNGNVGIGTVAPSTKLHVQDYTTNYVSFVHNTRVDGHGLLVKAGDPAQVEKYPLAIQNRNDTNLLLVKSNGLVTMAGNVDSGVVTSITNTSNHANADGLEILAGGSTVESIPLNVKRRDGTALFKIYGNGTFFTHSGQASRKELKKNIRSLESEAMLLLREIKVVTYKYKVDEDSRADRIGFIANDDEHFYDDRLTNTRTGFDTPSIVGVMIKAFQEIENKVNSNIRMLETMQGLHTKVENNSRKIASLEDQVEQLKDHNQELEATNQEMKAFLCVKYSEAPFCH